MGISNKISTLHISIGAISPQIYRKTSELRGLTDFTCFLQSTQAHPEHRNMHLRLSSIEDKCRCAVVSVCPAFRCYVLVLVHTFHVLGKTAVMDVKSPTKCNILYVAM